MNMPSKSLSVWTEIVTGKTKLELKFIPAKILVGRFSHLLQDSHNSETIASCIEQLYTLYLNNTANPVAQQDIKTLLGQEEL
jgi:hypothetical protein